MTDLPRQLRPHGPELADFRAACTAWQACPDATTFPLAETRAVYLALGKHFVPEEVTTPLAAARAGIDTTEAPLLRAFLDCALDKQDGRYDYGSYCALEVLGLPEAEADGLSLDQVEAARDRILLALLGDLVAFECDALAGQAPLPLMRPDPALSQKRIARCLAALRPALRRQGWVIARRPTTEAAAAFLDWRERQLGAELKTRMALSLLPVHVVHDEYMFLRILQAFEASFAWSAVLLRGTIASLPVDGAEAVARLGRANDILRETARLFPLLGTMQIAAFQDFRRFTEGASAIQSTGYKVVESLCRRPDPARLDSVAYTSVPTVRDAAEAGQTTLEEAFEAACAVEAFAPHRAALDAEMTRFSGQLMRWRQAHYQIAKRFLGERGGTGYTEGVPYLDQVRSVPVFGDGSLKNGSD